MNARTRNLSFLKKDILSVRIKVSVILLQREQEKMDLSLFIVLATIRKNLNYIDPIIAFFLQRRCFSFILRNKLYL